MRLTRIFILVKLVYSCQNKMSGLPNGLEQNLLSKLCHCFDGDIPKILRT